MRNNRLFGYEIKSYAEIQYIFFADHDELKNTLAKANMSAVK